MKYELETVVEDSVARLTTQAAAVLLGAYTLISVLQTAATQDLLRVVLEWFLDIVDDPDFQAELSPEQVAELETTIETSIDELHLALGLSPGAAVALLVVVYILALVVLVVALDTFGRKQDRLTGIEPSNIAWKVLNLFVGSIAFFILVFIGFIFFVLPGIAIMVLLLFFPAAIAIDNKSFISAFGASFNVATDNLLATVVLVVVAIIASVVLGVITNAVTAALPGVPGAVVSQALNAVGWIFGIALIARAYADATQGPSTPNTQQRQPRQ